MKFSTLNFDAVPLPAYGVAVKFGRRDSSWHKHDRFNQITMATAGTLRFDDEAFHWLLPPDRAAVVPAGVMHRVRASGPGSLSLVYFDRDIYPFPSNEVSVLDVPPLAREMICHVQRWGPDREAHESLADDFFGLMIRLLPEWLARPLPLRLPRPHSPELERAVAYLLHNLDNARFDEAAAHAGLSSRSLSRRFREETGIGWRSYSQVARVLAAVERLARPEARVTDVAYEVGFSSVASFSTAFRKLMGMSPRAFRNQPAPGD